MKFCNIRLFAESRVIADNMDKSIEFDLLGPILQRHIIIMASINNIQLYDLKDCLFPGSSRAIRLITAPTPSITDEGFGHIAAVRSIQKWRRTANETETSCGKTHKTHKQARKCVYRNQAIIYSCRPTVCTHISVHNIKYILSRLGHLHHHRHPQDY
jgi:hypothetical protein